MRRGWRTGMAWQLLTCWSGTVDVLVSASAIARLAASLLSVLLLLLVCVGVALVVSVVAKRGGCGWACGGGDGLGAEAAVAVA